jgi:hypothetical protein
MTTEKMGPIRCHVGRVTADEACEEPATVEIRGPVPKLMCAEHARAYLEDMPGERWQDYGAEGPVEYARRIEEAADALRWWMDEPGANPGLSGPYNGVLYDALAEAATYLETYALWPAREVLVAAGEVPRATCEEVGRLEFYRQCAERYGWTDTPGWAEMVESWLAHEEKERSNR